MRIDIQAKDFTVSEKLDEFIKKRVEKLERFYDHIMDVIVHLTDEHVTSKEVVIRINVKNETLVSKEKGDSFEQAVDNAVEASRRQLKKYKEKIQAK